MNYNNPNRYQHNNNKRKQMEDEMSRFENEISGPPNYQQSNQKPGMPAMFIPHQLQRPPMMPPNAMQPNLHHLPPNTQPPFMSTNNLPPVHLAKPPMPMPMINSQVLPPTGFKPMIQPFVQPNIPNQSNSSAPAKPSYTVTPMALPANVHNVSNPVQPSNAKKQKTTDSSKNNANKKQKKIVRIAGGTTWEGKCVQSACCVAC